MQQDKIVLQVQNITFQSGNQLTLNNISLTLRAGEFKLITGPSGCGKSTLLKLLASLISPTSGKILFEGADINTLSPENYRQNVSYCAQTPALFGETVYDNLNFPWQLRKRTPPADKFLRDLAQFDLPAEMLKKSINELSGGEKQRVALMRNLQFIPRIMLLDEITSALDEANKQRVHEIIRQHVRVHNMAVLWVTHDKDEISHADDVLMLDAQERTDERA